MTDCSQERCTAAALALVPTIGARAANAQALFYTLLCVAQAKLIARSQRRAAHARTGVFWWKWLQRVGERMHARVTATLAQSGPRHVPGTRQSPLTEAPSQARERQA